MLNKVVVESRKESGISPKDKQYINNKPEVDFYSNYLQAEEAAVITFEESDRNISLSNELSLVKTEIPEKRSLASIRERALAAREALNRKSAVSTEVKVAKIVLKDPKWSGIFF